jgi:hypothetical protein
VPAGVLQRPTSSPPVHSGILDAHLGILDAHLGIPNARLSILDAHLSIPNARLSILDIECFAGVWEVPGDAADAGETRR